MKIFRLIKRALVVAVTSLAVLSCSKNEEAKDYFDDYGYVQFRLFKEASYQSKAIQNQLDFLNEAYKVKVTLLFEDETLTQTLFLQKGTADAAEYGLRSEKLKLYKGDYTIISFMLYDSLDQELYKGVLGETVFQIVPGNMSMQDLTVNVVPRGKVHFTMVKDMSAFTNTPSTKSVSREYTFDEIKLMDLTFANVATNERVSFNKVATKFVIDYDGEYSGNMHSSVLTTEEDFVMKAGDWKLISYNTYTSSSILLEANNTPAEMIFTVQDNEKTNAKLPVLLYESDEYIKDYYALYEFWLSLGGPDWYYKGTDYPIGTNWNFDKDPDLWGDQPGVEIYDNGRIATISLEGFNFSGHVPAAIGQLKELNQLYLGNHNDPTMLVQDSNNDPVLSKASLFQRHKARMESLHSPTPMSQAVALALKENNISIPEIAMYETMKEEDLIDKSTGISKQRIKLMDNVHGVLSNTLQSIDPAIGELQNLQYLFIANSTIKSLPDEIANLSALTDFELYNCPEMHEFPMAICEMPELISVNIANNLQWDADEIYKGLKGLANGKSASKIQIIYMNSNNLEELPEDVKNFKALGLFDAMSNKISKLHPFGRDINLVDLYLDNNLITEIPTDELGFFCGLEDVENFSVTYNKLTELPDIFTSKTNYYMGTVDFSNNLITKVQNEGNGYKGINVSTLSIANNLLEKFPVCFSESESHVSYFNLRANRISDVPEEAFEGESMLYSTSFDLSYNHISELPEKTFNGVHLPYLYGLDLTSNRFSSFPYICLDSAYLTVLSLRSQRDADGNRCLREWPTGIYQHKGLRGLYLGSNDLRKVSDTISTLIYILEISDNPNITFDASDICYAWRTGAYMLIYDKSQNILNCDYML